MSRRALVATVLLALGFAAIAAVGRAQDKVVAYVPNWIDLAAFAGTIDYAKVTHLNLAFENPTNAEGDLSYHAKNDALIAPARAAGVKILISIGGGSASTNKAMQARYFDLLTAPKRAGFVAKLTAFVEAHHFDGLDVDIEGPSINADYGAFVHDLALALKPKGKLLTAALSRGYGGNKVPDATLAEFDFINIMAYDGTGSWSPDKPGQHSSLEFAQSNTEYWLKRGLPKAKAVLGVPFYGYGFGQDFRSSSYAYAEVLRKYPGAEKVDQIGDTIWYNGIPTIRAKVRYAKEQGLGGLMIWSLDNDVKGDRSLLAALDDELKATAKR
jgi:chitinase